MAVYWGGSTPRTLVGTKGDDVFRGGTGDVIFVGNGGNDIFDGGYRDSRVDLRTLTHGVTVNLGLDSQQVVARGVWHLYRNIDGVWGTAFADNIGWGNGNEWLSGEGGDDQLWGGWGSDQLFGGVGNDKLDGGSGNDKLRGDAGNDMLRGGADHDDLDGGIGHDLIYGDLGNDQLAGAAGDDMLDGGAGIDGLNGGDGNDQLFGGAGGDAIVGGRGIDTLSYDTAASGVSIDRGDLTGRRNGGDAAWDTITGVEKIILSRFDDMFVGTGETWEVHGGAGNDQITGSGGLDRIDGGAGNDKLSGGGENDILYGQDGQDRLSGGGGFDIIYGGSGNDVFLFAAGESTQPNPDRIMDFQKGDRIDLSAIDARVGGADNSFTFVGARAFSGAAGELTLSRGVSGAWLVQGDTNGDKLADFALLIFSPTAPVDSDFTL